MTIPRPKYNQEIALRAALATAAELCQQEFIRLYEIEDAARDIARCARPFRDGFQLAKELENSAGWECSFAMSQILDGHQHEIRQQVEAAEIEWAQTNNVTPPFPIGHRVKMPNGEIGVIDAVDDRRSAKFQVKTDSLKPDCFYLVNFEDAISADLAEQAAAGVPA